MDKVRLVTEVIQLIAAFLYLLAALREMKFLGYHMFIENLVRVFFILSSNHSHTK